jgi:hypothetical protein
VNDEGRLPAAPLASPNLVAGDFSTAAGRASLVIRVDDRGRVTAWIESDSFESEARLTAALERTPPRAAAEAFAAAVVGLRERQEAQRPPFVAAVDRLVRAAGASA